MPEFLVVRRPASPETDIHGIETLRRAIATTHDVFVRDEVSGGTIMLNGHQLDYLRNACAWSDLFNIAAHAQAANDAENAIIEWCAGVAGKVSPEAAAAIRASALTGNDGASK